MQTMFSSTKFTLRRALLTVALAALTVSAASAQDNQGQERSLRGTWRVDITLRNCVTGAPLGVPFQSLLTFDRGGTMTETTSNGSFFPAERGPGHGIWQRTDVEGYRALSLAYITLNGVLVKTQSIDQRIVLLDGDHFRTTSAAVSFVKPDGSPAGAGCATANGKRLEFGE